MNLNDEVYSISLSCPALNFLNHIFSYIRQKWSLCTKFLNTLYNVLVFFFFAKYKSLNYCILEKTFSLKSVRIQNWSCLIGLDCLFKFAEKSSFTIFVILYRVIVSEIRPSRETTSSQVHIKLSSGHFIRLHPINFHVSSDFSITSFSRKLSSFPWWTASSISLTIVVVRGLGAIDNSALQRLIIRPTHRQFYSQLN